MNITIRTKTIPLTHQAEQETSKFLSTNFYYESPHEETQKTRGRMYGLYCVSTTHKDLDLDLLAQKTKDVLIEEYFQKLEGGITNNLSRSIFAAQERFAHLSRRATNSPKSPQLNLGVGVLWGNIFYYRTLGECLLLKYQNEQLEAFHHQQSGSHRVNQGDTYVFIHGECYQELGEKTLREVFVNNDPGKWQEILRENLSGIDPQIPCGALLILLEEEETPSSEEIFDIGMVSQPPSTAPSLGKLQSLGEKISALPNRLFNTSPKVSLTENIPPTSRRYVITGLLAILLIASITGTYLYRRHRVKTRQRQAVLTEVRQLLSEGKDTGTKNPQEAGKLYQEARDLLLTLDENAETRALQKKLTTALRQAYKITEVAVNQVATWPETATPWLYTSTASGILNPDSNQLVMKKQSDWQEITAVDIFRTSLGHNLYLLDKGANTIHKYLALGNGDYSKRFPYLQEKPDLGNVTDLAIDGAIYLLYADGTVEKYLGGKSVDFSLRGFYPDTQGASLIFTRQEVDHLYIAHKDEIFVFDKEGLYQRLIKTSPSVNLGPHLYVNDEETLLWSGSGNEIYQLALDKND